MQVFRLEHTYSARSPADCVLVPSRSQKHALDDLASRTPGWALIVYPPATCPTAPTAQKIHTTNRNKKVFIFVSPASRAASHDTQSPVWDYALACHDQKQPQYQPLAC